MPAKYPIQPPAGYLSPDQTKLWRSERPRFPHLEDSDRTKFALYILNLHDLLEAEREVAAMEPGPERNNERQRLRQLRVQVGKQIEQLGVKVKDRETASRKDAEVDDLDLITGAA